MSYARSRSSTSRRRRALRDAEHVGARRVGLERVEGDAAGPLMPASSADEAAEGMRAISAVLAAGSRARRGASRPRRAAERHEIARQPLEPCSASSAAPRSQARTAPSRSSARSQSAAPSSRHARAVASSCERTSARSVLRPSLEQRQLAVRSARQARRRLGERGQRPRPPERRARAHGRAVRVLGEAPRRASSSRMTRAVRRGSARGELPARAATPRPVSDRDRPPPARRGEAAGTRGPNTSSARRASVAPRRVEPRTRRQAAALTSGTRSESG